MEGIALHRRIGRIVVMAGLGFAATARAGDASRRAFFEEHAPSVVMITAVQSPSQGAVNRTLDLLDPFPIWSIPFDALRLGLYPVQLLLAGPIKAGGSGVIIDAEGHVLTNHHVIVDCDVIWVTLHDRRVLEAELVGSDRSEDYALLKIKPQNGLKLRPAKLGESADLQQGDRCYAIGSPLRLHQTFTAGQISGRKRRSVGTFQDYLQMDLTIGSGSSGGPLFNAKGEVIGLTTLMYSTIENTGGVTMAVPIDNIKEGLDDLKKAGKVTRGFIGVHIKDCTSRVVKKFNLKVTSGACIWEFDCPIWRTNPARRAGLRPGDVVTRWGDRPISEAHDLARAVLNAKPGGRVVVTYARGDKKATATVVVGKR
jgi:serine protease Do